MIDSNAKLRSIQMPFCTTAPDGAVNPSAATPAACFPLWTFRGLE
ncbi:hypothetical protein ACFIBW_004171 [Escherichia coli]